MCLNSMTVKLFVIKPYYEMVFSQGLSPSRIISVSGERGRLGLPGLPLSVTVLPASPVNEQNCYQLYKILQQFFTHYYRLGNIHVSYIYLRFYRSLTIMKFRICVTGLTKNQKILFLQICHFVTTVSLSEYKLEIYVYNAIILHYFRVKAINWQK